MKRIIDGMSAEQIADGCVAMPSRGDLLDYLETICKPAPSWEDDVRLGPVLCWVGDSLEELEVRNVIASISEIDHTLDYSYHCTQVDAEYSSASWKHARPIDPNECRQPAKKGA